MDRLLEHKISILGSLSHRMPGPRDVFQWKILGLGGDLKFIQDAKYQKGNLKYESK